MKKYFLTIVLWTVSVWTFSFVCYLPMLLENNGADVPKVLTAAKYLFVIVPLVLSVIFAAAHGELKKWLAGLFSERIKMKSLIFCAVTGAIGLAFSFAYSLIANESDLFVKNYPTFFSVIAGSAYLFLTALAEESAWRGYLLNKLSDGKETPFALIYTGIAWAVWHIPMWTIRNSLGIGETALYFLWTVLLSFVLGKFFLTYKNVIATALLHMLFNTCFIAPVQYNVVLLSLAVTVALVVTAKKHKNT
ncbi:MAG: CPBP family intramembrane metalloprotease [Ruminococcaceae bacterium]|nr:CPBP family intramembrane metalloprotease [Oscillospiraceae bacterium]